MACYVEKLGSIVNSTLVGLALTLSKDVGILQVLLDAQKPLTSHEIAGERDLKERYVRELLYCLATAEVIRVSTSGAGSLVYHLEEEEKQVFRTELTAFISIPLAMMKTYDSLKACINRRGPQDVGILQVLLDAQKPLTSHEIAGERDLKERYVRELLDSLATAEVIHVSTNEAGLLVYHLEEDEKRAFRTEMAVFISTPLAMMKAYDSTKACVSRRGPQGFRMNKEFHDSLEEFGLHHNHTYVDTMLRCVDGLKPKLESGIKVIEFGCGRGHLLVKLAQMFPKSAFTASDNVDVLQEEMKSTMNLLPNISYDFIDLCSTSPCSQQYDWVICVHVIHDVPNPQAALKNIRNLLKPGGTFTMIEMAPSGSPLADRGNFVVAALYAISSFSCVPESYQQEDSHAMGLCWGKQKATELLTNAGFDVKTIDFEYPITLYVCT